MGHVDAQNDNPARRPGKHPSCPLRGHANGKWYIKRKGRFYYFGSWSDPDGAEREYDAVKHLVREGKPLNTPPDPSLVALVELADRFLTFQESRVSEGATVVTDEDGEGDIGYGQFDDYRRVLIGGDPKDLGGFVAFAGPKRPAESIDDDKLHAYRQHLRAKYRAHTANRYMQWVRAMFRWGHLRAKLIRTDQYNSYALRQIAAKRIRKERRLHEEEHGAPIFTRRQVRRILRAAKKGSALRAMILLALNCGYGQRDVAELRISKVKLERRYINYTRRKKEMLRQATLWPETVRAIKAYLKGRPKPKSPADADILFITRWGGRFWARTVKRNDDGSIGKIVTNDSLRKEFDKLLRSTRLVRAGRGFYALRRVFASWADLQPDRNARLRIMGQQIQAMDPHYVRLMPRSRLRKVTDFVRQKVLLTKLKPARNAARNAEVVSSQSQGPVRTSRAGSP